MTVTGATVRIDLPLTLTGLLVEVGEAKYGLPLSSLEECVEMSSADVERSHGSQLATIRGERVPYLRLRDVFGVRGKPSSAEHTAITRSDGTRYGLIVDHVIGQQQTVIKSLGPLCRHVKELSGATVLGDRALALIIDVPALVHNHVMAAAVA